MNQRLIIAAAITCLAGPGIAHADKAYNAGKGGTWDCKKDPVVHINSGSGSYTLKGSCKMVNLNAGNTKLTIESTENVSVSGSNNKLTIGAVDHINVVGSDNTVSYKSSVRGGAPSVNNVGSNNVVSGPPAAAGGNSKPEDDEAPADARGAQDCASAPTAVINDSDGTYKFVGPCTKIVVNGSDNTVAIESVEKISVAGSTNTVTIGSADKISVLGSENKVSYRKGISAAKPKVSSLGSGNKVSQTK